jgi:PAS domain S-box-containing protein
MAMHADRPGGTERSLQAQLDVLRERLQDAEDALDAVRSGSADAVIGLDQTQPDVLTLKGSDNPYRIVVEMMGEGSITLSSDGTILYCNNQFAQMVERTPQQLLGSQLSDLLPSGEESKLTDILSVTSDTARRRVVKLARSKQELTTQITTRSLSLAGVNGVIATVTDLTDLEKSQRQRLRLIRRLRDTNAALRQASRAKDAFLARMSHELRTPLTAIIGYAATLLMKLPGPLLPEQEKQVSTIRSSGQLLLSLINDILDFAKVESGAIQISPEKISSMAAIQEVVSTLRQIAEQKGLRLEMIPGAEMPELVTDRRALTQILINLVNNAIKFTKEGSVTIETERAQSNGKSEIRFRITDTGVGIAPEDQQNLFQAFYQAENGQVQAKGNGLGLYLSRRLAKLLGGDISFESVLGQGSTFTLTLPDS